MEREDKGSDKIKKKKRWINKDKDEHRQGWYSCKGKIEGMKKVKKGDGEITRETRMGKVDVHVKVR